MFKKSSDYRGRLLYGDELVHFHTLGVGQKLGFIRGILNEEYPGEFTRDEVAKKCGVTYQAIRFMEELSKRKPRDTTLNRLVEIYNISLSLLEDKSDKPKRGFRFDPLPIFIGKPEDEARYLKDREEQEASIYNSMANFVVTEQDLLEVDLDITAHVPNTPFIVDDESHKIAHRVKLTLEDIQVIKEIVGMQIELLVSRREALIQLNNNQTQEEDPCP